MKQLNKQRKALISAQPSALELLTAIESKGFTLTLDVRTTPQKWITGKNLFMGITGENGVPVRGAYGPIVLEMPLRVAAKLKWELGDGSQTSSHLEAFRNTVKSGLVRRSSHLHRAMLTLSNYCNR